VVGDAAAHRLARAARDVAAWQLDAARRLAEGFMEYAREEARLLAPRAGHAELADGAARLRDALERLEKRIERLE
jgi:ubiquinone biosynthesis protein UbiJ